MPSKTIRLPAPLRGIVPPMVTPLLGRDRLDVAGLERLVEHLLGGGVHGLFVLGTSGEAASLGDSLRRELVTRTCKQVAGRVPVLVGVTDTRLGESIDLARHSADAGAAAAVVATPCYLPPDQSELYAYAETVAAEQPLPLFLYNIPSVTKTPYEPETVRRLAEIDNVVGIKDSSGDLNYLKGIGRLVPRNDWTRLVGVEQLLAPAVAAGCHGCVAGGANLAPRLFVDLYDAAIRGDAERISILQNRVLQMDRIYRLGDGVTSVVRGIKGALACMGICSARMADPFRACDDAELRTIRSFLAESAILPAAG